MTAPMPRRPVSMFPVAALALSLLASASDVDATPRRARASLAVEDFVPSTARYLVQVGPFASENAESPVLCDLARSTLVRRLAGDQTVFIDGSARDAATVRRLIRRHRLRGYVFDGRMRVVRAGSLNRVEVSLLVQTHPEREYRFEASVAVTLSGGSDSERSQEISDATRRAASLVAARAVAQLGS